MIIQSWADINFNNFEQNYNFHILLLFAFGDFTILKKTKMITLTLKSLLNVF